VLSLSPFERAAVLVLHLWVVLYQRRSALPLFNLLNLEPCPQVTFHETCQKGQAVAPALENLLSDETDLAGVLVAAAAKSVDVPADSVSSGKDNFSAELWLRHCIMQAFTDLWPKDTDGDTDHKKIHQHEKSLTDRAATYGNDAHSVLEQLLLHFSEFYDLSDDIAAYAAVLKAADETSSCTTSEVAP